MARVWCVVALAVALLPETAGAQRLEDPDANIVAELVVQARELGPAWCGGGLLPEPDTGEVKRENTPGWRQAPDSVSLPGGRPGNSRC